MIEVKVNSNGQITIPASQRKRLGMEPGMKVNMVVKEDGLELWPVNPLAKIPVEEICERFDFNMSEEEIRDYLESNRSEI